MKVADKYIALLRDNPDANTWTETKLGEELGCNPKYAAMIRAQMRAVEKSAKTDDKKVADVNWRELVSHAKNGQRLKNKMSASQASALINIKTDANHIIVQPLSDLHLGSFGTDYDLFCEYTDIILNTPNLYCCLVGDLTDHFVAFKNMAAIHGQALNPKFQLALLKSWIDEIKHKVLFTTWCNHSEFEEKASGLNSVAEILKAQTIHFDQIGQCAIVVNDVVYTVAVTHKTRYWSSFNKTHGLKQLMRRDIAGQDIYIAGDKHDPSCEVTKEQNKRVALLQMGTLKVQDSFGQRYFSSVTHSDFPCLVLNATKHCVSAHWTLDEAFEQTR